MPLPHKIIAERSTKIHPQFPLEHEGQHKSQVNTHSLEFNRLEYQTEPKNFSTYSSKV